VIVDSVLINAKAYLKGQIVDCSIAMEDGKIYKIGKETQMPSADEKTNLHNLLVLPGLIDEHVHLRDEGKAYKEDFVSGTSAAAAGGFTTVLDMPNNEPVTMSAATLRDRMALAARRTFVNVGLYSEFPRRTSELQDIVFEGAVGFKLFMGSQIGGLNIDEDEALQIAFKEVSTMNVPVAVHAEDKTLLYANEEKLRLAKKVSPLAFEQAHSEEVEFRAIERLIKISATTDVRLHFCHVSTAKGLEAISEAKKAGRKVTCEVTPNHLFLSASDLGSYGQLVIMAPPLRNRDQVKALWKGVEEGTIDTVGSDHAPHAANEKVASNVWNVKVGVPGLETTLPLMLTEVRKNRLSFAQVVGLLAEKPAEIFGLKDCGQLEQGKNADISVIDFNEKFKIDASKFKSKAKFSPYEGWEVFGKLVKTYVNGNLVFDDGEIVAKAGSGSIVRGEFK
jgi:dihydroorotase (multifunctional complex type)